MDDPCSCKGGGFEIYEPFCNVSKGISTNASTPSNISNISRQAQNEYSISNVSRQAQIEYTAVPDSLDTGTLAAAAGTVAVVAVIFVVYRTNQSLWAVEAKVEEMDREREAERLRQQEENKFLEERLAEAEAKLEAGIEGDELDFDAIEFEEGKEAILGTGSFGVVRRARLHGEVVAVKKIKIATSHQFWRREDAAAVEDFISEINVMNGLR